MQDKHNHARRAFLKHAAAGGAAIAASPLAMQARAAPAEPLARGAVVLAESAAAAGAGATPSDKGGIGVSPGNRVTYSSCGGDYMVDVMRSLGIEHFAATPGSTFMGLHEAIINYGMLTEPGLEFVTTLHEEASVAMAHGYAKIEGRPMACGLHTTVGLQHASMAIYNAWCDRVPIFMVAGAWLDASTRDNYMVWDHAAQDGAALVRDFTKWDDMPGSLGAWGESAVRAYKFAMTPPYGPVLLATDTLMQEKPQPGDRPPPIPRLPQIVPPVAEEGAIDTLARWLIAAERPVIFADRCARTTAGLRMLVELAELVQAPVCDTYNRMNFPWRHPLNQSQQQRTLVANADLLLELEPNDPFSVSTQSLPGGELRSRMEPGSKRVTISSVDLFMKSNYQNFQRYAADVDIAMAADAEATLPALIESVRRHLSKSRRTALQQRGAQLGEAHRQALAQAKEEAARGWDDRPISVPRVFQELYAQIRDEDWSLVSGSSFQSFWPQRLWSADRYHRYIGGNGGGGQGYNAPATLGAALANRKHGRLSVCVNGDGDMMFGPGILWTAAHERIPLLYIVHNNRAYHAEIMQLQAIANRRERGIDRVHIGSTITDPNIDYGALARSLGVYGEGPVENPADLGPALARALAVVRKGEPALVDVVAQGR